MRHGTRRSSRRVLILAALVGLAPVPSSAWPADPGTAPPRGRHPANTRPAPGVPQGAIVSGYLPRNHNVPMYNEPPRLGPAR